MHVHGNVSAPMIAMAVVAATACATAAGTRPQPFTLPAAPYTPASNGGHYGSERRVPPAAGTQPHLVFVLLDDWGWGSAGWHNPAVSHTTPNLNRLVAAGIELDRHYVFKYCSPTRCAIQSGRAMHHVNLLNTPPAVYNERDTAAGAAGMARNMTGIGMKLAAAGYKTHYFGKVNADAFSFRAYGQGSLVCDCYMYTSNNEVSPCSGTSVWRRWTTRRTAAGT